MDNQSNAGNQKEFLGITQNECTIQGKVVGNPTIHGDNYAYMQIKVMISEVGSNGQWVDTPVIMPVMTMDPKKVDVIQKYVEDGRTLLLNTFYKPWTDQNGAAQHVFMIKKMTLGAKKYVPRDQAQTPGLPQ